MDSHLILIVEDEPSIAEVLEGFLRREGFRTERVGNGASALRLHRTVQPDLVLLDVKLPDLDGFEVLRQIRDRQDTPVIMVTAMAEDLDKLLGLRMGADDYILKPFNPLEVVARVRTVLRRAKTAPKPGPIRVGPLEVDPQATSANVGGHKLSLTLTEYRLLEHLARHPNRTFTRTELFEVALPDSDALERTLNTHLNNLRNKLEAVGAEHMLETVRGLGYKLVA